MPHTEELPPTETNDFPLEFQEQDSKTLRRFLVGSTLGTMKVSMQEPPPLFYDALSVSGSTEALMKLEFESTNSMDIQKSLQSLSFTVYFLVRVKTFYSVKSFPRLPSQSLLDDCNETKLRDGIINLETRAVRDVLWGYRYDLEDQATAATLNPPRTTPISTGSGQSNMPVSNSCVPNGKWISNWKIPVEIDGRLLPTFCSSLVARFYTLIIRVKVAGVRQESFDLEVPLQVLHNLPGQAQSAMGGPVREPLREFRRISETSWFSDEALVRHITAMSKVGLTSN